MTVLQGSVDGNLWKDLDDYICRKDAEKYAFPSFLSNKNLKVYQIPTTDHFGLPLHDGFPLYNAYKIGLYTQNRIPV
jgi:hypothetical protein